LHALAGQVLSFRLNFKEEIIKQITVKAVTELLVIEIPTLTTIFFEICTACMLFLTLTVTVITAELSFLRLKLIKKYLRSTMLEERLSGLGKHLFKTIEIFNSTKIINSFAK